MYVIDEELYSSRVNKVLFCSILKYILEAHFMRSAVSEGLDGGGGWEAGGGEEGSGIL